MVMGIIIDKESLVKTCVLILIIGFCMPSLVWAAPSDSTVSSASNERVIHQLGRGIPSYLVLRHAFAKQSVPLLYDDDKQLHVLLRSSRFFSGNTPNNVQLNSDRNVSMQLINKVVASRHACRVLVQAWQSKRHPIPIAMLEAQSRLIVNHLKTRHIDAVGAEAVKETKHYNRIELTLLSKCDNQSYTHHHSRSRILTA